MELFLRWYKGTPEHLHQFETIRLYRNCSCSCIGCWEPETSYEIDRHSHSVLPPTAARSLPPIRDWTSESGVATAEVYLKFVCASVLLVLVCQCLTTHQHQRRRRIRMPGNLVRGTSSKNRSRCVLRADIDPDRLCGKANPRPNHQPRGQRT